MAWQRSEEGQAKAIYPLIGWIDAIPFEEFVKEVRGIRYELYTGIMCAPTNHAVHIASPRKIEIGKIENNRIRLHFRWKWCEQRTFLPNLISLFVKKNS
jgi:hypothetical protein